VAVVRTDISEERIATIRVVRISELGTIAITVLIKTATRRHIPADGIIHSHRREDHRSYIIFLVE
jgi:hypothetical protein